MSKIVRVVVTGSREWTDTERIEAALQWAFKTARSLNPGCEVVLVHGGAKGADLMAAAVWSKAALKSQVFIPEWRRLGKAAGFARNVAMLEAGADVVLAFHVDRSPGTEHTITEAVKRGVPVWLWAVREGEARPALKVTGANIAGVFPPLGRGHTPMWAQTTLPVVEAASPRFCTYTWPDGEACGLEGSHSVHRHPELVPARVYHDSTEGTDRCGECGEIVAAHAMPCMSALVPAFSG